VDSKSKNLYAKRSTLNAMVYGTNLGCVSSPSVNLNVRLFSPLNNITFMVDFPPLFDE